LMRQILLGLFLSLFGTLAHAQGCGPQNPNCIVPTAPVGTSNNQAASTEFVQLSIPAAGQPLTKTDDTNVTVTLGGSPTTALVNPASITMGWAGTLAVTRGGTGIGSGTSGGIPYFNSSTTIASSGVLTSNQLILGGGAGAAPTSLGSLGTTTTVLHGNAGGAPSFGQVVSADIASGTVANSNLATMAADTVKCNATGSTAAPTDCTQPTLGVNGGTGGQITLNGSTSGSVTVKTAAAAGTSVNFQLPTSNGSSGQLLQTDGSGNTSWTSSIAAPGSNVTGITDIFRVAVNSFPISGEFGNNTVGVLQAVVGAIDCSGSWTFTGNCTGTAGYARSNASVTPAVGAYGQATTNVASAQSFGGNFLVTNFPNSNGTGNIGFNANIYGAEIDVNIQPTGGGAQPVGNARGLYINGNMNIAPTGGFNGIEVDHAGSVGWGNAFRTDDACCTIAAIQIGQQTSGSNSASQQIQLNGRTAGGVAQQGAILLDATGNLLMRAMTGSIASMQSGTTAVINGNTGTTGVQFPQYTTNGACSTTGGTGVISCSSDARLKDVVGEYHAGLVKVLALQPKTYYWKHDQYRDLQVGFIAQDVDPIIPEAISHSHVDPDTPLGFSDRPIIAALVNAVKELNAQIEELKKKQRPSTTAKQARAPRGRAHHLMHRRAATLRMKGGEFQISAARR
jgi:hypothetical protein